MLPESINNTEKLKDKIQKYSQKINNLLNQEGGTYHTFKSAISTIHVDAIGERFRMWFETGRTEDAELSQSNYNPNDIDKFYLKYMNFMYTFLCYIGKFDNILMIGLGGGQLQMLLRKYHADLQMDIIEIDPVVEQAASKMGFSKDNKMNVVFADGSKFCKTANKIYDAIVIDLDNLSSFENFDFGDIARILDINGVCTINSCQYGLISDEILSSKLKPYFKIIKIHNVKENYVYICKKIFYDPLKNLINEDDTRIKSKYATDIIKMVNLSADKTNIVEVNLDFVKKEKAKDHDKNDGYIYTFKSENITNVFVPENNNVSSKLWFDDKFDISNYNGEIQSEYSVGNINQIYLDYLGLLLCGLNYLIQLKSCLIIGLGGGFIPMNLRNNYPLLKINVIEINKAVLPAAYLMGYCEDSLLTTIFDDGSLYIKKSKDSYDFIVIDIDGIKSFSNFNFDEVARIMDKDGVLVINCNYSRSVEFNTLINKLKPFFKSIQTYIIHNNCIYICLLKKIDMTKNLTSINSGKFLKLHKSMGYLITISKRYRN